MLDQILTKDEIKLRKRWWFCTIFRHVFCPLLACALFACFTMEGMQFSAPLYLASLGTAAYNLIPLVIIWCCAYRKCGTRMLTFWLIVSPIRMVADLSSVVTQNGSSIEYIACALDVMVLVWWYSLSLKMRKINKKLQEAIKEKIASPVISA